MEAGDRFAAVMHAHETMLRALFVHVFSASDAPMEEATACRFLVMDELEKPLGKSIEPLDAELRHIAIDAAERSFASIIAGISASLEPIPYRPAGKNGTIGGTSPAAPLPDGDDETPD